MNIGWPECILLGLVAFELGIHFAKAGESRGDYNPLLKLIDSAILLTLLSWGGFFA